MSEHNHDCGCGHDDCNCGEENLTVTLTLDNDEVLECAVLTIFSAGDRQYIALLPLEDAEDTEEGDVSPNSASALSLSMLATSA